MAQLFLLAVVADTEIAISSDCIESVITIGEVVGVPKCDPLVAGLIALRSRVLTLVDCQFAVTAKRRRIDAKSLAVIVEVAGQSYALSVDKVHDVVAVETSAIKPVTKLAPQWENIVENVVEIDNRLLMIISPEMMLSWRLAIAA